jgi:hypothetical protein
MCDMAQKSDDSFKIQTQSIPELDHGLTLALQRLQLRRIKHRDRKLARGPMLNALFAWFLAREHDEQEQIVVEGLKLFEGMLAAPLLELIEPRVVEAKRGTPGRIHRDRAKRKNPRASSDN